MDSAVISLAKLVDIGCYLEKPANMQKCIKVIFVFIRRYSPKLLPNMANMTGHGCIVTGEAGRAKS